MYYVFSASGWALFLPRQVPVLSRNGRSTSQHDPVRGRNKVPHPTGEDALV
jgi:hypothetical protein